MSNQAFRYLRTRCSWSRLSRCQFALKSQQNVVSQNFQFQRPSSTDGAASRRPQMTRGPYATLSDSDVSVFEKILDTNRVLTDPTEVEAYNEDWLKTCKGAGRVVLKPRNVDEVSALLTYCNERRLAVVPQGGNTGLVGGSVPVFDEIVMSTQLLNNIMSIDDRSGSVVCQAGVVLETLENTVAEHGLAVPVDLGAKGSCHIGGNIATNAGGIRLLKYGSLHGNVLGIEAVLADGSVVDCLSSLRKDNTGYDVKQMFIGSEGTLGVITAASILCPPRPKAVSVALLGCETFSSVLEIFKTARSSLAEVLSAFEMMDWATMDVVTSNLGLTCPISPDHPFYVLIETSGSHGPHDEEKLTGLLQQLLDEAVMTDGTVATDLSRIKSIWSLREGGASALLKDGYCYKYDFSVPLSDFYSLVEVVRERLQDRVTRVVGYGHVGDGNLHLNVTTKEFSREVLDLIEPFVYDWVAQHHGSVSAEHGLGLWKRKYIYHSQSVHAVDIMRKMKSILDPNAILNPYKVIPAAE